jgi:hypothetical protein
VCGGVCVAATIAAGSAAGVAAQEKVTLGSDVLLYGDNTEFRNPFREGETILGAAARVFVDVGIGPRATLTFGGLGNERFGSARAFDLARPVLALTISGRRSTFVFGTYPAAGASTPIGPDRDGAHRLLPALQRETLAYERPYEAGLLWNFDGARLHEAVWIDWQRVITAEHRERFDGGFNGSWSAGTHVSLPLQLHVVHQGGQQETIGPVTDSYAGALGLDVHGRLTAIDRASIELFGLASRYVPDRASPSRTREGSAVFVRGAFERGPWRAHVIVWRGRDFVKDEGDSNYSSLRHDGRYYGGTRDYAEAGLARRFTLAPDAVLEISGRVHRTERFYEYSYRVFAIASPRWRIK